MNTNLITLNTSLFSVELATGAESFRQSLLDRAKTITQVSDEIDQDACVSVLKMLKEFVSGIEKTRKDIKSPVLDLGKKIDSVASCFTNPVEAEVTRLTKTLNLFQAELLRKQQEAEAKRLAELKKLEEEKQQAEALRLKAIRDAESAKTNAELSEAQSRLKEANQKLSAVEIVPTIPAVQTSNPEGLTVKKVWKFEVISIQQLAVSRWDLVRCEPNTAAINQAMSQGMTSCPGLKIWSEIATQIRK